MNQMATAGWSAINRANGMLMHGCGGGAPTTACLANYPRARDTTFGATWEDGANDVPGAELRVLHGSSRASVYWTRSSPDGRFVAHTDDRGLVFVDLQDGSEIATDAQYDPSFFPDGSGFLVQGPGAISCASSVLTATSRGSSLRLASLHDCESVFGVLLQSGLAASAVDYWAVGGLFVLDPDTAQIVLQNPAAPFGANADVKLVRMVNTGSGFADAATTRVTTPFEGDVAISPMAGLLLTRVSAGEAQDGYALRRLNTTGTTFSTTVLARYCGNGGAAMFSYDERWAVMHQYVEAADAVDLGFNGPGDPAFAPYLTQGASNVVLLELATGRRVRITNMPAGRYARSPHFRSDGWIYFVVRDTIGEHLVASNLALVLPPT